MKASLIQLCDFFFFLMFMFDTVRASECVRTGDLHLDQIID